ncbi:unnamed protein product [Darwinula stevensoni]|uniref:Peroxidase n=1 Tax=Darwinula stevensoni TaxID=69355 RepID=A0A7R8X3W4_9CRUS|nr:unnamed protein product [Darwinula stevensoni]CAG0882785.1 unnamed protein product [Darwinula stevensoni]
MESLMMAGATIERPSYYVKSTPRSREIGKMARINRLATSILEQKLDLPRREAEYLVRRQMLPWERDELARSGAPPASCSGVQPDCDSLDPKYPTYSGVCNNLAEGDDPDAIYWGSAEIYYRRVNNSNAYDDGISIPRGSGPRLSILPNPREVSSRLHGDSDRPATVATHMLMQWGQFLDHDITLSPADSAGPCCEEPIPLECLPIAIPPDDPFYSQVLVPQTCMPFHRSTPYCAGEVREQINMITAFIDGSSIYGSSEEWVMALRSFQDGKLVTNTNDPGLLPTGDQIFGDGSQNFVSGDIRLMENPGLQGHHTLFMREHNRLAEALKVVNPQWDDERLFQEARRIVGAELQNIHYGEFLPVVFGSSSHMDDYGLTVTYPSTYDSSLDPSLFNVFGASAYRQGSVPSSEVPTQPIALRFGHSLVQNEALLLSPDGEESSYFLMDNFGNATPLLENGLAAILAGLAGQDAQSFDTSFADAIRNYLFKLSTNDYGQDLVARTIQRGRDHGILGYNDYRTFCGTNRVKDWDSRPKELSPKSWSILRSLYTEPDDMDASSAAFLEEPLADDAMIGPTMGCYVAEGKAFEFLEKYDERGNPSQVDPG